MCQYPSFVSTWRDGAGLQVYAAPDIASHSGAVAHHKLDEKDPSLTRWNVDLSSGAVVLSHDQAETGETARTLAEMQRLWPALDKLLVHLVRGLGDISASNRGCAAREAACNGHLACLRAVLASGAISAAGEWVPDERHRWAAWLSHLRGKRVSLTLATERHVRSAQQNRYWWACVVPIFQEVWSIARTQAGLPPYDRDETHDVLAQVLIGYEDGPLPGTRVRKRTRDMAKPDFAKLVDAARELALHQYGIVIPAPGEE